MPVGSKFRDSPNQWLTRLLASDLFKKIFSLERVIDGYLYDLKSSSLDLPETLEEQEKDTIEKQSQIDVKTEIVEK